MPDTKIKWLEYIDDMEAEILLSTIDAAQHLWEDEPPVKWWHLGFTREDVQELRAKLLEFRLRVRGVDRR